MSLNHLKNIDEKEDPELAAKQNKVRSTQRNFQYQGN